MELSSGLTWRRRDDVVKTLIMETAASICLACSSLQSAFPCLTPDFRDHVELTLLFLLLFADWKIDDLIIDFLQNQKVNTKDPAVEAITL